MFRFCQCTSRVSSSGAFKKAGGNYSRGRQETFTGLCVVQCSDQFWLGDQVKCRSCFRETSVTSGTVMHRSKTQIHVWFWAAFFVATQTPGISALELQKKLGISRYETAFQLLLINRTHRFDHGYQRYAVQEN